MRLFTGIDVPYEMKRNLELLLELLRPTARVQWSALDNLHVTTKFIGEWDRARLDELKQALDLVPRPGELKIAIRGLGWFPNPHQPRVFFVGIAAPPELGGLARATDAACAKLGIEAEKRDFHPHLTLARIREPLDLSRLRQSVADLPGTEFGAFTARQYHLYSSELRPGGSSYTKQASYSLSA